MSDLFTALVSSDIKVNIVKEYRFHPVRRWRFDYYIPDYKIAIEVEGGIWTKGRHTRGKGYKNDMEKYSTAASMGFIVLRVTPQQLNTSYTLNLIKNTIQNINSK